MSEPGTRVLLCCGGDQGSPQMTRAVGKGWRVQLMGLGGATGCSQWGLCLGVSTEPATGPAAETDGDW